MQPGADGTPDHHRERRECEKKGRETDRERHKHLPLAVFSVHGGRSGL